MAVPEGQTATGSVQLVPSGSDAPQLYETFKHKQDECVKVVLKP